MMEARYPEQGDKAAAAEGTACHWVAQQLFEGWAADTLLADGKTTAGHPITRDMVEAAQLLVDDVRDTLAPYAAVPVIEQRVSIPAIHATACWGTPDVTAWASYVAGSELFLYEWDLKYGHKHVEIFENWQLIAYASGRVSEMQAQRAAAGAAPWPEDRITCVLRVVQPRSYHRDGPLREWRIRAADLAPYVFKLSMAAEDATGPTPQCKPQPDACEDCTARHACEALQRAAYRGIDLAQQAQAVELTPAAMGLELRYLTDAAALMEARITGLKAQVDATIRQGGIVPHWKFEPGTARMVWLKPAREVITAGELMGIKLAKDPEPITPTQAKQAGFPEELLGTYAYRPSGAVKLTVDDGSDARKVFAKS